MSGEKNGSWEEENEFKNDSAAAAAASPEMEREPV